MLTQRILELLIRGTRPERIAAITFTEKSAGELQARVRDALEARLARGQAIPDGLFGELPRLTLSTIHGFCHRLLTAEAVAACWAPATEVLPNILEAAEVEAAFRAWETDFRRRHRAASLVVNQLVNPRTLRAGAMRLLSYRDLRPRASSNPFDPAAAYRELQVINRELHMAGNMCTAKRHDKLLLATHGLLAVLRDAVARPPIEAVVRILASGEGTRGNLRLGRRADWPGESKQMFVYAMQQFRCWRAYRLENLHGLVIHDLAKHFVPVVTATKLAAAVADYDDLLFRAAELLHEQPEARRRLAARFDAVLIDEVQDTDPIQAEVAALLTRDPSSEGEWNDHPPVPGRLFAVGDPRQSIYRFRRADEDIWRQLEQLLTRAGEPLRLSENFRSVPGIVEWVNATFAHLPGYERQRAHRQPASGPGALAPVVRLALHRDATELDELGAIARYLIELRRRGSVPDAATGSPRPLSWSDVMLLLPSWSKAEALQDTLTRAGIPCVVEGGGKFMRRDEVRLALAALKCIDEPGDEQSAVFVLRGLFGLRWSELAEHRKAGGAWRYTIPDPPPGPVADAFAALAQLARRRGRQSWTALLDELLERSGAPAVWALLRDGAARLANLDKLRALLRRLEATARTPSEVLRRLERLDDEHDLSRLDPGAEAVRVTSYFKAKGLEAPVVLLCFGHRRAERVDATFDRRARQVVVKLGDLRPVDWDAHAQRERTQNDNERRRWMYVAATRARDQLVIVDHPRNELIREHLALGLARGETVDPTNLPTPAWRDQTFGELDPEIDAWLAQPLALEQAQDSTEQWRVETREAIARARAACTSWSTVHELASSERVAGPSSAVGVVGGNLIHAIMRRLDFGAGLEQQRRLIEALARPLATKLGIDEARARLCVEIMQRMLEHSALAAAREAPEHWVEVAFTMPDADHERLVSGRIDLAFPTDASRSRWIVVDWKSDLPPRGSPGRRNYARQLERYAKGVLACVPSCEQLEAVLVGPYPELLVTSEGAPVAGD